MIPKPTWRAWDREKPGTSAPDPEQMNGTLVLLGG